MGDFLEVFKRKLAEGDSGSLSDALLPAGGDAETTALSEPKKKPVIESNRSRGKRTFLEVFRDSLNKEETEARLQKQAEAERIADEAAAAKGKENIAKRSEFTRGLLRGIDQTQATFYGGLGMLSSAMGDDKASDMRFQQYREQMRQASENPATVDEFFSTDPKKGAFGSVGNLGTYAAGTIGSLLPTIAESAVTGVAGAAIGGAIVPAPDPTDVVAVPVGFIGGVLGRGAMKKAIAETAERYIARGVAAEAAQQMGERAVKNALAKRIGATIGTQQITALQEGGGMYAEGREAGYDNPWSAILLGQVSGASEGVLGNVPFALRTFIGKTAVREAAQKFGAKEAAGLLWDAVKNAGEEAVQESFQEFLGDVNSRINDPNQKIFTKENFKQWAESGAAGALAGGILGGGGVATQAALDARRRQLEELRAKGFISKEEAKDNGIEGSTRREIMGNAEQELADLNDVDALAKQESDRNFATQQQQAQAPQPQAGVQPEQFAEVPIPEDGDMTDEEYAAFRQAQMGAQGGNVSTPPPTATPTVPPVAPAPTVQPPQAPPVAQQTPASFAARMARGEQMTSPEDQQYRINNAAEIEAELQKLVQAPGTATVTPQPTVQPPQIQPQQPAAVQPPVAPAVPAVEPPQAPPVAQQPQPLYEVAGDENMVARVWPNPKGFLVNVADMDSGEVDTRATIFPTFEQAKQHADTIRLPSQPLAPAPLTDKEFAEQKAAEQGPVAPQVPVITSPEEHASLPMFGVYERTFQGQKRYGVKGSDRGGFGDSMFGSPEAAQAESDRRFASSKDQERKSEESKKKAEEDAKKKADYEASFGGFLSTDPKTKGRQLKVLGSLRQYNGKAITVKDLIEQKIAGGAIVNDSGQLESPDGAYLGSDKITKIGMDYARRLIANKAQPPTETEVVPQPESQPATAEPESQPSPEGKTEAFRLLPEKSRSKFESAWESNDPQAMKALLHSSNKVLRAEFGSRTGEKLPRTAKGTDEVVDKFYLSRIKRETINPADDKQVGKNAAGEQLYERENGDRYRWVMNRNDRPNGYPDFGGDLSDAKEGRRYALIYDAIVENGGYENNSSDDVEAIRNKLYDGADTPTGTEIRAVMGDMRVEAGRKVESEQQKTTERNMPSYRNWRFTSTAKNSGKIVPNKVGVKFSPSQMQSIVKWAESEGYSVSNVTQTGIRVLDPSGNRLDIAMFGIAGVKDEESKAASKRRSEATQKADEDRKAKADGRESASWITDTFGGVINDYNRNALSDYLEGVTDKFAGSVSANWKDGLEKLGALSAEGKIDWKKVKSAYVDSRKPTEPPLPPGMERVEDWKKAVDESIESDPMRASSIMRRVAERTSSDVEAQEILDRLPDGLADRSNVGWDIVSNRKLSESIRRKAAEWYKTHGTGGDPDAVIDKNPSAKPAEQPTTEPTETVTAPTEPQAPSKLLDKLESIEELRAVLENWSADDKRPKNSYSLKELIDLARSRLQDFKLESGNELAEDLAGQNGEDAKKYAISQRNQIKTWIEVAEREDTLQGLEDDRAFSESFIKIVADDVSKIRKQDVYRLLSEVPSDRAGYFENWLSKRRPDLASEITTASNEILLERSKEKQPEPPAEGEMSVEDFVKAFAGTKQPEVKKGKKAPPAKAEPATEEKTVYSEIKQHAAGITNTVRATKGGRSLLIEFSKHYYTWSIRDVDSKQDIAEGITDLKRAKNVADRIFAGTFDSEADKRFVLTDTQSLAYSNQKLAGLWDDAGRAIRFASTLSKTGFYTDGRMLVKVSDKDRDAILKSANVAEGGNPVSVQGVLDSVSKLPSYSDNEMSPVGYRGGDLSTRIVVLKNKTGHYAVLDKPYHDTIMKRHPTAIVWGSTDKGQAIEQAILYTVDGEPVGVIMPIQGRKGDKYITALIEGKYDATEPPAQPEAPSPPKKPKSLKKEPKQGVKEGLDKAKEGAKLFIEGIKDATKGNTPFANIPMNEKIARGLGMMADGLIEAGKYKFADFIDSVVELVGIQNARSYAKYLEAGWNKKAESDDRLDKSQSVLGLLETKETTDGEQIPSGTTGANQEGNKRGGGDEGAPRRDGVTEALEGTQPEDGGAAKEPGDTGGVRSTRGGSVQQGGVEPDVNVSDVNVGGATDVPGVVADGAGDGFSRPGDGSGIDLAPKSTRPNFHLTDPNVIIGRGLKDKFARNVRALELSQELEESGRAPTQDDLEVLASYIGWGAFGQELFQGNWNNPRVKKDWESENEWLREHLGEEEWRSAQESIPNAHYTDPEVVSGIWAMIEKMGFKGGRFLEPSFGVGNFAALMPRDMMSKTSFTAIELDKATARIAKILYPQINVQQKGYQDSRTPSDFYDVTATNVPFGDYKISDRMYRMPYSIHNYFFRKAIDQTKPGGLMVFVTSNMTMDGKEEARLLRKQLSDRGDLVAAFRFPTGAFERYAKTKVVADLIIIRKRKPGEEPSAANSDWIDIVDVDTPSGEKISVNSYWTKHPENILGTLNYGHGTTSGRPGMIVDKPENLDDLWQKAIQSVPSSIINTDRSKSEGKERANERKLRQNTVVYQDGDLYIAKGEQLLPLKNYVNWYRAGSKEATIKKIRDEMIALLKVRSSLEQVLEVQGKGDDASKQRAKLNEDYDAFRQSYGPISTSKAIEYLKDSRDAIGNAVASLENLAPNGEYEKRPVFTRTTVRQPPRIGEKLEVVDAFALARNNSINIDWDEVAKISRKPKGEVLNELQDQGLIYKTGDETYDAADVFLSGNMARKIRQLEAAKNEGVKGLDKSITAAKAVLPEPLVYNQIQVGLGAPWITAEDYSQFFADLLGEETKNTKILKGVRGWKVDFSTSANRSPGVVTHGHSGVPFSKMVAAAMNNGRVSVFYKDAKGESYKDEEATLEANAKIDELKDKFKDWIWQTPDRIARLSHAYNEDHRSIVTPDWKKIKVPLLFEGLALQRGEDPFSLRKHQEAAVYRAIVSGKGLFAHEVGTGKTLTMASVAIESRRLRLANKPVLFAHNANSQAVYREAQEAYPGAKILYVDNLDPANKSQAMASIATEDWDLIVIPHSLVENLKMRPETLEKLLQEQMDQLEAAALEAFAEDDSPFKGKMPSNLDNADADDLKKLKQRTAKELVKERLRLRERIREAQTDAANESTIFIEDMGIDMLMVDEAHIFKKIPLATRQQVKGLNKSASNIGNSLMLLSDYIRGTQNGRGIYLFTGTPITNTLNEIYNMQRFIMPEEMQAVGVKEWDGWFSTFATSETSDELSAGGTYEEFERLTSFVNLPELRASIGQYMDTVFASEMSEFVPRLTKEGRVEEGEKIVGRPYKQVHNETLEMMPIQRQLSADLKRRYTTLRDAKGKAKYEMMRTREYNPLVINTEGVKMALDPRLMDGVDPSRIDPRDSRLKINKMIVSAMDHYNSHPKATQMIFMEIGHSDWATRTVGIDNDGKAIKERVRVYNLAKEIKRRLIEEGVAESEIAIFSAMNKEQRAEAARAMNRGEVRFAIGGTETLGTGVNAQENLVAMHHLDAPWMPGSLEQRNGRGHRQGNRWNTVHEYRYLTEGPQDGRRWQVLLTKDRFIYRFMHHVGDDRVIDMSDVDMDEEGEGDFESTFAAAVGDPRIRQRFKLSKEIEKLVTAQERHYRTIQDSLWEAHKQSTQDIPRLQEDVEDLSAIQKSYRNSKPQVDENGKTQEPLLIIDDGISGFPSREIYGADAIGNALQTLFDRHAMSYSDARKSGKAKKVAEYRGVGVFVYGSDIYVGMSYLEIKTSFSSLDGLLRNIGKRIENKNAELEKKRAFVKSANQSAKLPFVRQEQLDFKRKKLKSLVAEIEANPEGSPPWFRNMAPVGTSIYIRKRKRSSGRQAIEDMQGELFREQMTGEPSPENVRLELEEHAVVGYRSDTHVLYEDGAESIAVEANKVLNEQGDQIYAEIENIKDAQKQSDLDNGLRNPPPLLMQTEPDIYAGFRSQAMNLGLAAEKAGITAFEDFVAHSVKTIGTDETYKLGAYLKRVGEIVGMTGIRPVKDILGVPMTPEEYVQLGKEAFAGSPQVTPEQVEAGIEAAMLTGLPQMAAGFAPAGSPVPGRKTREVLTQGDFDQPADYEFTESDYRPVVVSYARDKWGSEVAANGKPTWQNFVRWFDDSAVVDKDGKPLVVYHGTAKTFDEFFQKEGTKSPSKLIGFFFSPSAKMASDHVARRSGGEPGSQVYPVYLSVKNPYVESVMDHMDMNVWSAAKIKKWKQSLIDEGYDGIYIEPSKSMPGYEDGVWIAFDSTQIKSATGNRGTFDPNNPNMLYQDETPRWYLKSRKLIQEKMGPKATSEQVLGMLRKNGVNDEELYWSGLEELLGSKQSVAKDEVLAAIDNGFRVEEVQLPSKPIASIEARRRLEAAGITLQKGMDDEFDFLGENGVMEEDDIESLPDDQLADIVTVMSSGVATRDTRYFDITTPGGKGYTELLLTLPVRAVMRPVQDPGSWVETRQNVYGDKKWYLVKSSGEWSAVAYETKEEAEENLTKPSMQKVEAEGVYRGEHWDNPNVLAHIRFNERTDADGKRVMFIEEAQSDWHQEGRKQGYTSLTRQEKSKMEKLEATPSAGWSWEDMDWYSSRVNDEKIYGVPDAPFKKSWPALVMKRAIQYASENGFDRIAWTTGKQQAARYNLSKVRGEGMKAFYDKMLPNETNKLIKKFGVRVGQTTIKTPAFGMQGKRRASEIDEGWAVEVFDEGLGEWNEEETFETKEDAQARINEYKNSEEGMLVSSFDITPAMRQSALQYGQPLFQRQSQGGNVKGWTKFISGTRALIGATNKADISTVIHEYAHVIRRFLLNRDVPQDQRIDITDAEIEMLEEKCGVKDGNWDVSSEEKFAKMWEQYFFEGESPNTLLDSLFAKISRWMRQVYQTAMSITGGTLDPEVSKLFDKMVQRQLPADQRTGAKSRDGGAPPVPTERQATQQADDDNLTSVANAYALETRMILGLPGFADVTKETFQEWIDQALQILRKDPTYGNRLVKELAQSNRNIDKIETAVLELHLRSLKNLSDAAADRLFAAVDSKDDVAAVQARRESDMLINEIEEVTDVTNRVGTEQGRSLAARKIVLRSDFTLAGLRRTARVANAGQPLNEEQSKQIEELAKQIAKLEGDLAKETQKNDDLARKLAAKESIDDTQKEVGKPVRNTATNRAVKKVESFVSKFVNIFGKRDDTTTLQQTEDEAMAEDGEEVIKSFVEAGVYSFGEFMSKFKAVIKGDVPVAARAALRKAWEKLKGQGDIPAPEMSDERQTAELRRLAKMVERNLVEFGITDPEEVIDGVHEALQEVFEDVTRREAMDAMSGYGQYSTPSQEPNDKIIRDLNAQFQQMAKLDDMKQGVAPKKSGRGRDEPSPDLRELIREVNEMKRNSKYFVTDPEAQLKTIFQATRTALRNRIYDLNKAIKTKEPIPGRTPNTFEGEQAKEIESLRKQRDELMATYKATFPKPGLTFEQRAAIAERALDREITKIEQQLASGDVAAKERPEPISTPALKNKQNRLESLRAQREAAREMQMTDADKKERADRLERQAEKAYVANLLNRIADYEDRKRQGYFGPKEKKEPRKLSPREIELSRQLVSLKDEFFRYAAEYRLKNMGRVERAWDNTKETMNLSRAIMTSFDLSAVFRQGGIVSLAHPRLAAAASREMWDALRNQNAEFDTMDKIEKDALYAFAMQCGLPITTDKGKIQRQEEAYAGRMVKYGIGKKGTKLNTWSKWLLRPVTASGRAYTTFLNSMRFRLFKYMVSNLGAGGAVTVDEGKVIASYISAATGRADLGKFNQAAANLNTVFFAPRYVASRFQYLAMPFYLLPSTKVSGRVKKMIAMEYARHAMGLTAFLGLSVALASLLTDDEEEKPTVEFDPRSSDFMKLKIGDTRIDPMAGLSQTVTLIGQMATGQKKGLRGDIKDLYGENRKFGDPDLWDVGTGFLRKKLAPIPGAIVDLRVGENVIGEKETVLSATTDLFVPLSFQEAGETMKARGLVGGSVVTALSLLGMGGGTYGPKTQYATADTAKREELFKKDLENVKWDDPDLAYKDFLTTAQLDKFNKQREGRKQSLVFSAAADPKRKDYNSDETFKKSVEERDKALDAVIKAGMGPKETQLLLIAYYKRNYGSAYETRGGVYQMKESLANRLRTIRRKLNEKKTPAK